MRVSSRGFILFVIFVFLLLFFVNFLDDSSLILANFLFVVLNLFIFLREFLGEYINDDIANLYCKYVYYYEVNIEYLRVLQGIYFDRCSDLQNLFIELYISIYLFYYRRFFRMLMNSHSSNLKKVETFLFTFLENEILLRKYTSLGILVVKLTALERHISLQVKSTSKKGRKVQKLGR